MKLPLSSEVRVGTGVLFADFRVLIARGAKRDRTCGLLPLKGESDDISARLWCRRERKLILLFLLFLLTPRFMVWLWFRGDLVRFVLYKLLRA